MSNQQGVYSAVIMNAQATDETISDIIGPGIASRCHHHTFYIAWGDSVSAGVVEIEAAPDADYGGTWVSVGTATYASGSPMCQVIHANDAHLALRARISTAVSGGTVSVTYVGN